MAGVPTTYSSLKDAINDAQGIDPASEYAADSDRFIDLVEKYLDATLRTRRQLATTSLSIDNDGEASLPSDYIGPQRFVSIEGGRRVALIEVSPQWLDDQYPYSEGGLPRHVAVDGDVIRVRPIGGPIELNYYQEIPKLDNSQTTNWVLADHPGVYLYGALYEFSVYYGDSEGQERYGQAFSSAIAALRDRDRASRIYGRRLGVKGATP